MSSKIYDWEKLKGEFKRGNISTIQEFLREKGIKFNGYIAKNTTGWVGEREEHKKKIEEERDKRAIEVQGESEAQVRARQAKIAKSLAIRGLQALSEVDEKGNPVHKIESVDQARRLVVDGLREERSALDLDKKIISTGNVNIAILNTRYGEALKELSNGGLNQLIEGLRKLDTNGTPRVIGGSDISEGEIAD